MSKAAQEKAQEECTTEATAAGFKAAAQALVAARASVGLANQFWAGFRRSMGWLVISETADHEPSPISLLLRTLLHACREPNLIVQSG